MTTFQKGGYARLVTDQYICHPSLNRSAWRQGEIFKVRETRAGEVGIDSFDYRRRCPRATAFIPDSWAEPIPTPTQVHVFRAVRWLAAVATISALVPKRGVAVAMQLLQQLMQDPLVYRATTGAYATGVASLAGGGVFLLARTAAGSIARGIESRRRTRLERETAEQAARWAAEDRQRELDIEGRRRQLAEVTDLANGLRLPTAVAEPNPRRFPVDGNRVRITKDTFSVGETAGRRLRAGETFNIGPARCLYGGFEHYVDLVGCGWGNPEFMEIIG